METFSNENSTGVTREDSKEDEVNSLPKEEEDATKRSVLANDTDSEDPISQEPRSSQYVTAPEDNINDGSGEESALGETEETDDRFAAAKDFLEEEDDISKSDNPVNGDDEEASGLEKNGLDDDDDDGDDDDDDNGDENEPTSSGKGPKLKGSSKNMERGIVYLSSIPTAMDLQQIRAALSNCGKLGRVFLQEDHNSKKRAKRTYYSEGWVEFKSKKDAKRAAKMLNCSQVGGKKRHLWFADTWHIKYLPKFKWHHLVDRLAYERAVEEQKMRIEVGAARKEAHHFRELADKADGDKRTVKKGKDINRREWQFYQKQTEEEIKRVIEKKGPQGDETGPSIAKKKRKIGDIGGGGGGGTEKRTKREIVDEKKTKKRELIKSIFQGGDSDE